MKQLLILLLFVGGFITASAKGYNADQEALRSGIEENLKGKGYDIERRDDGLKFTVNGNSYYIEIDETQTDPMFVRLARYVRFDDSIKRENVMKNMSEYNSAAAVKIFCMEKNVVIAADLFITTPEQFNSAFDYLFNQLTRVAGSIK